MKYVESFLRRKTMKIQSALCRLFPLSNARQEVLSNPANVRRFQFLAWGRSCGGGATYLDVARSFNRCLDGARMSAREVLSECGAGTTGFLRDLRLNDFSGAMSRVKNVHNVRSSGASSRRRM